MLRWSASQFCIASRQNVEKCIQCWDQPLPNLSLGCARDIGKIIVFQRKRIDFRITGILENLLFSTKNKQTIFRSKTNGELQQICTKKFEKCESSRNYEIAFFVVEKKHKRERWERGEEGKNSKEKEGSKRARRAEEAEHSSSNNNNNNNNSNNNSNNSSSKSIWRIS